MLIKISNMPDISNLKPKAAGCFLAGSLVGRDIAKTNKEQKTLAILARLIDKAITEYTYAKEYIDKEEAENKMTYDQILKRGQGQPLYTCPIINHLENCITTLSRIYKINAKYLKHKKHQGIIDVRNSIEHVDERIRDSVDETPVLNISEDSLVIEIAAKNTGKISIKTKDIAEEIISLYKNIRSIL